MRNLEKLDNNFIKHILDNYLDYIISHDNIRYVLIWGLKNKELSYVKKYLIDKKEFMSEREINITLSIAIRLGYEEIVRMIFKEHKISMNPCIDFSNGLIRTLIEKYPTIMKLFYNNVLDAPIYENIDVIKFLVYSDSLEIILNHHYHTVNMVTLANMIIEFGSDKTQIKKVMISDYPSLRDELILQIIKNNKSDYLDIIINDSDIKKIPILTQCPLEAAFKYNEILTSKLVGCIKYKMDRTLLKYAADNNYNIALRSILRRRDVTLKEEDIKYILKKRIDKKILRLLYQKNPECVKRLKRKYILG